AVSSPVDRLAGLATQLYGAHDRQIVDGPLLPSESSDTAPESRTVPVRSHRRCVLLWCSRSALSRCSAPTGSARPGSSPRANNPARLTLPCRRTTLLRRFARNLTHRTREGAKPCPSPTSPCLTRPTPSSLTSTSSRWRSTPARTT